MNNISNLYTVALPSFYPGDEILITYILKTTLKKINTHIDKDYEKSINNWWSRIYSSSYN